MKKSLIASVLLLAGAWVHAADATPVGTWRTIDDKTKEAKSEVVISDRGGVLTGRISRFLRKDADASMVCSECTDDRKGRRVLGLEIIRGARKAGDKNEWEGGKILDPESGKVYTLRLMPGEDGRTLRVRGYIGPFYRTQTWVRVQ